MKTFSSNSEITKLNYHMHTNFTDGKNTIEEYVIKAKKIGLKEIAITDHVWRSSDWVDEYVQKIKMLRKKHSFKILVGLEAKVIDFEGHVDISDADKKKVDFIMGVVHRFVPEAKPPFNDLKNFSPVKMARIEKTLTLKIMRNPDVDVIGHPTRTFYKFCPDRTAYDFPEKFLLEIVREAAKTDKPLEYNSKLLSKNTLLKLCLQEGARFTLGSDAHSTENLGDIEYGKIQEMIYG